MDQNATPDSIENPYGFRTIVSQLQKQGSMATSLERLDDLCAVQSFSKGLAREHQKNPEKFPTAKNQDFLIISKKQHKLIYR